MRRRTLSALFAALLVPGSALPLPQTISARARAAEPDQQLTVIRDAETETLLHKIADPLFRAAGLSPGLVRIIVVRDRAINAFVSTGNRMFINTGLIQQAGSGLEVAGTIAHETGHIVHGDISRLPEMAHDAMLQALGSLLIAAAAGVASREGSVGVGTMMGATSMLQRRMLSFSRAQEEAADLSAVTFLDRVGWSSRGLLTLFDRLEQQEALQIDRQDPYLVSHPLTPARREFVQHHLAKSPYRDSTLPMPLEEAFRMVQAKLDGFLEPPQNVLQKYPGSSRDAPALYARAIALHRLGHSDDALVLLDRLIIQQPLSPWLLELKGQILFESGQGQAALAAYRQAVRLAPEQPLIHQSLAHVMIETDDPSLLRPAIAELEAAQRRERDDATTWHLLGIAWGRLGNLGEAHLALAEEAMLADDIPVARRLARQAAAALPAGPAKLRALDISNAVKKENRS
jgi:predicted Zn-dependent protease